MVVSDAHVFPGFLTPVLTQQLCGKEMNKNTSSLAQVFIR